MTELDSDKVLAFELKSGKEQIAFGVENGAVSAIFESIHNQHRKELKINLGGFDGENEYLNWLKRALEIGEKLELKVVRVTPCQISEPSERKKSVPPTDEQLLKVYHEQKKELEEAGLI
jgi:hypothetical protein